MLGKKTTLGAVLLLVLSSFSGTDSLCKDDSSVDCANLNAVISICNVKSQAMKICPKFCNLCKTVDGKWAPWSPWSKCDVTCGKGSLLRHRTCSDPAPQNGGEDCPGNKTESEVCELQPCPVHGGWSSWDNWGNCSATCGVGMWSRKRSCSNPRPQLFGDHCFGDSIEYELCNSGSCAVDGGWSEWSNWGNCSISCGVGFQTRSRSCTNPTPQNAGRHCIGQNFDVKHCYTLCHLYTDCKEIMTHMCKQPSGVYNVRLWKSKRNISVYCDFDTDSGGWTVFQYRFDGSVDFFRKFSEYEQGFGLLNGEFWLGLQYMYEMVAQRKTELRIDLTAADGTTVYETFQNFRLGDSPYYTLHIDKGVGTAGDDEGLSYNNGHKFSTYDVDHDGHRSLFCAIGRHGGWWYNSCSYPNLNGKYVTPGTKISGYSGMVYYSFKNDQSLRVSKMMFRSV